MGMRSLHSHIINSIDTFSELKISSAENMTVKENLDRESQVFLEIDVGE